MMATAADPMMLCPLIFIQQYFVMLTGAVRQGMERPTAPPGGKSVAARRISRVAPLRGAQNADIAISNRVKSKRYCHGAGIHSKFSAGCGLHGGVNVFNPAGARKGPFVSPASAAALLGGLQPPASPASGISRICLYRGHGASAICWPASSPADALFRLRLLRYGGNGPAYGSVLPYHPSGPRMKRSCFREGPLPLCSFRPIRAVAAVTRRVKSFKQRCYCDA